MSVKSHYKRLKIAILNSKSNTISKPISANSLPRNCSIQNEEQEMDNEVHKNKDTTKPCEQKQKKLLIISRNFNPNIKENDLGELFGLTVTNYLKETCSLNKLMNDKAGQFKGYALVYALNHFISSISENHLTEATAIHLW